MQLAIEGSCSNPEAAARRGGEGAFPQPTALSKALLVAGIADGRNMVESIGSNTPEEPEEDAFVMLQNHQDADGIHFTGSVLFALGTK
jgi:hypothetical protein